MIAAPELAAALGARAHLATLEHRVHAFHVCLQILVTRRFVGTLGTLDALLLVTHAPLGVLAACNLVPEPLVAAGTRIEFGVLVF